MWTEKDRLNKEIGWSKVLDWVVIDGVLWVEVADEPKEVNEVCTVQC